MKALFRSFVGLMYRNRQRRHAIRKGQFPSGKPFADALTPVPIAVGLRKVRVATRLDEELGCDISTEVSVATRLCGGLEFATAN